MVVGSPPPAARKVRAFFFLHKRNASWRHLVSALGFHSSDNHTAAGAAAGSLAALPGASSSGAWSLDSLWLKVDDVVAEDVKNYLGCAAFGRRPFLPAPLCL